MKKCQIEEIIVKPNRQRQEFDRAEMDDLDESFDNHGILHLPVCRREGRDIVLVAGERRLRLLMERYNLGIPTKYGEEWIPLGECWYNDLGELSIIQAEEAELDENLKRTDLSWQDQATAEARLHALRSKQKEMIGQKQTLTQTAAEIKNRPEGTVLPAARENLAQNIILSKHLDDEDVMKAKSPKDAMKVIQKKAETEKRKRLAEQFDIDYGHIKNGADLNIADPAIAKALPHDLRIGDSLDIMSELPAETFQCLLTDPPYGIAADTFGDQSLQGHAYIDSYEYFQKLVQILAEESFRFCTPQAHAYVFCDPRRFDELVLAFQLVGWKVWPIPLIWVKNGGMLPRPDHGPRRTYETIMFASKGDKKVQRVAPDAIQVPMVRGLLHGAQKPVSLYEDLLSRSCNPGDKVVDPFTGSGTIFPAANRLRLKATGIELPGEYESLPKLRMLRVDDFLSDQDKTAQDKMQDALGATASLDAALNLGE